MGGAQQPSSCALARASWVAMVPSCHPHGLRWCPHAILMGCDGALMPSSWVAMVPSCHPRTAQALLGPSARCHGGGCAPRRRGAACARVSSSSSCSNCSSSPRTPPTLGTHRAEGWRGGCLASLALPVPATARTGVLQEHAHLPCRSLLGACQPPPPLSLVPHPTAGAAKAPPPACARTPCAATPPAAPPLSSPSPPGRPAQPARRCPAPAPATGCGGSSEPAPTW
jgi:hypothetical protein